MEGSKVCTLKILKEGSRCLMKFLLLLSYMLYKYSSSRFKHGIAVNLIHCEFHHLEGGCYVKEYQWVGSPKGDMTFLG